ncbi:ABC transporter permease [Fructilactobacillus lindneri]|nr:ECF transporter S component [Fructilactobacillus lindneri]POH05816.1 ABC transporter permease [Fructilactobacillus lindneri]POH06007.1 ABC transporter permease [Fructilactobacillus lindneri]POH23540.1 ABC transporter permease [Fructilactobacillus lindneri DSM 20690 = JCM 11027]SJZ96111.1 energy-coupling factor transport system substrate-specific component [Fructilactobacillus lindneri DSM 20690 = JCM 11027]
MKKWLESWHLKNIIMVTLIGVACGLVFWVMDPIYTALTAVLTPLGLAPFTNAILIGFWTMGGPLALMIIRIPGSGLLAEFFGAVVEMLLGGIWGAATLISGLIQGFGSELGFAFTGYKQYNWFGMTLSVITTTVVTFGWELIRHDYAGFSLGMITALFVVSLISVFLFSGVLTMAIAKLLERTHLIEK